MKETVPKETLADKLYRTRYEPDADHSHIEVDAASCRICQEKECLHFCPAEVYRPDPNEPDLVAVSHENCLECGTCRSACPHGAVEWKNPDGGTGVKYRFG